MPITHNRPGPQRRYAKTMELALRDDQEASVQRIAKTLGFSRPEIIRWFVDTGIASVEGAPTFKTLEDSHNG